MKAVIHGTGLIGASVGMALRDLGWEVGGWDPDPDALRFAEERGAIAGAMAGPADGLDETDLLVLAGPPASIVAGLAELSTDTLVTDVASVKSPVVAAAGHLEHFVGGHPMAGSENSGAAFASPTLFRGAAWILTDDGDNRRDLERMSGIVSSVGANPVAMTAAEHDEAVAKVSHLPHVLAGVLMDVVAGNPGALRLAAGGFRDVTRVAASEPRWWTEVLLSNSDNLSRAIAALEERLASWRAALAEADSGQIAQALEEARAARRELGPSATHVQVVLVDTPGELARVGRSLEASLVDVRDIQLRHAEHGGGGVLTLAVRPEEAGALRQALAAEGFELESGADDATQR